MTTQQNTSTHRASLFVLLLSNLLVLGLAWQQDWNAVQVLFVYWVQSMIMIIFAGLRILTMRRDQTHVLFAMRDRAESFVGIIILGTVVQFVFLNTIVWMTAEDSIQFLLLESFFTKPSGYVNYVFDQLTPYVDTAFVLSVIIFFLNHLFSFIYNRVRNIDESLTGNQEVRKMYYRILPLQIISTVGGGGVVASGDAEANQLIILIFMLAKTIGDILLHVKEHNRVLIAGFDVNPADVKGTVSSTVIVNGEVVSQKEGNITADDVTSFADNDLSFLAPDDGESHMNITVNGKPVQAEVKPGKLIKSLGLSFGLGGLKAKNLDVDELMESIGLDMSEGLNGKATITDITELSSTGNMTRYRIDFDVVGPNGEQYSVTKENRLPALLKEALTIGATFPCSVEPNHPKDTRIQFSITSVSQQSDEEVNE